jgi:hypothetical protein
VHQGLLELGYDSVRLHCRNLLTRCLTPLGIDYRQVRGRMSRDSRLVVHVALIYSTSCDLSGGRSTVVVGPSQKRGVLRSV